MKLYEIAFVFLVLIVFALLEYKKYQAKKEAEEIKRFLERQRRITKVELETQLRIWTTFYLLNNSKIRLKVQLKTQIDKEDYNNAIETIKQLQQNEKTT